MYSFNPVIYLALCFIEVNLLIYITITDLCVIIIINYYRGRRNTYHHTALIKIDGSNDEKSSAFYLGKKVAYIYKAPTIKAGSKFRVVWGKVIRGHGSNGLVRVKFVRNLPVRKCIYV